MTWSTMTNPLMIQTPTKPIQHTTAFHSPKIWTGCALPKKKCGMLSNRNATICANKTPTCSQVAFLFLLSLDEDLDGSELQPRLLDSFKTFLSAVSNVEGVDSTSSANHMNVDFDLVCDLLKGMFDEGLQGKGMMLFHLPKQGNHLVTNKWRM